MIYHMMAFAAGFVLDLIIGDPERWPHPVRWIGGLIGTLTKIFLNKADQLTDAAARRQRKRAYGVLLVVLVTGITGGVTALLLLGAYGLHPMLGLALEAWLTFRLLATKSLRDASMKVYHALRTGTLADARYAVSMIVGRDTSVLDEVGVTKAAVETVAENTSDGIIAPMIYTAIGGPILGMIYKSINTMDSMVAYKNDQYMDYGRAAAKMDDAANFLPARLSGLMMILAAGILSVFHAKEYSARNALRIFLRDRRKHASPNAAHTEAVCAGALSIQLAGDAVYFGEVHHKPTLGDPIRPIEPEDIDRANKLMLGTSIICEVVCLLGIGLCLVL